MLNVNVTGDITGMSCLKKQRNAMFEGQQTSPTRRSEKQSVKMKLNVDHL